MLAGTLTIIAKAQWNKISTGYHPKPVTQKFFNTKLFKTAHSSTLWRYNYTRGLKVGGWSFCCEKYAVVHIKTDTISRTNAILAVSSFDRTVKRGREQATITSRVLYVSIQRILLNSTTSSIFFVVLEKILLKIIVLISKITILRNYL